MPRTLSAFWERGSWGYLLFAVVAWEVGSLASLLPAHRMLLMGAVNVILAGVLVWYAYSARHVCGEGCAEQKLVRYKRSEEP